MPFRCTHLLDPLTNCNRSEGITGQSGCLPCSPPGSEELQASPHPVQPPSQTEWRLCRPASCREPRVTAGVCVAELSQSRTPVVHLRCPGSLGRCHDREDCTRDAPPRQLAHNPMLLSRRARGSPSASWPAAGGQYCSRQPAKHVVTQPLVEMRLPAPGGSWAANT